MSIYTLEPVAKGGRYTNSNGLGDTVIKVRAIVRDPETNRIVDKRGVILQTNEIREAPSFIHNVYKEWDGRGELEYCIFVVGSSINLDLHIQDDWTTLEGTA